MSISVIVDSPFIVSVRLLCRIRMTWSTCMLFAIQLLLRWIRSRRMPWIIGYSSRKIVRVLGRSARKLSSICVRVMDVSGGGLPRSSTFLAFGHDWLTIGSGRSWLLAGLLGGGRRLVRPE